MRILILGGDGMLGHRLFRHLAGRHEVRVTLRRELKAYLGYGLFSDANAYAEVGMSDMSRLNSVVAGFRPEAVINCVGVVKQRQEAKSAIPSIEINALLPHRLAPLARASGARLVQMSTDCVFSGRRGNYRETDPPDAEDLYGRTKLLGEVVDEPCLTLRTSIIGRELSRKTGLLEWFLAQRGKSVKGYRNAVFSGFTTTEMARIIERMLTSHPHASGLYHVSADAISKHDLLCRINAALGLNITVIPEDEPHCDRSLDSTRFREEFGYHPPSWEAMVSELAKET
ncbi:MAG: SDR family oxidoreductase [Gammaproteobacteria bacterium]|nr:SDR family oxidoreductase [Gammaproteobacteria bacterium]